MPAVLTDEKCPVCQRSRLVAWQARRGTDTWLCCDECKRGAGRVRAGVVFSPLEREVPVESARSTPIPQCDGQSNLLDHLTFADAAARLGDPPTSHAAAVAVTAHLTDMQHKVLALLTAIGRPVTDEELVDLAPRFGVELGPSSIRTRRKELMTAGIVVNAGYTAKGLRVLRLADPPVGDGCRRGRHERVRLV